MAEPEYAAAAGPSGYILTAETDAFTLDISQVEFHGGGGDSGLASLAISGQAKLKVQAFDLPKVVFKGLRINTDGHVFVEGGWLDVETAKSSSLNGFPFQITKIGFGAEDDDHLWIGLNGGIKLADGLPIGASVEGLRVVWNRKTGDINFSLEGIGVKLSVPGTFSIAGKVAFFSNKESTGFRGSMKLKLDTLKLTVDASMMIGRTADGTDYFFLFLDTEASRRHCALLDRRGSIWFCRPSPRPTLGLVGPRARTGTMDTIAVRLLVSQILVSGASSAMALRSALARL